MSFATVARYAYFPLFLVCYELAAYFSNDMYLPALTRIMQDLSTSEETAKLTVSAWFLGSASLTLMMGPLADKVGRRPVMLLGGVLFLLSTVVCGVATSMGIFLAARFIQGVAVTSLCVAGYATINEMCEQKEAIILIAWMNSFTVLAPALGPIIGVWIINIADSWRIIFYLLAFISAMTLIALFKVMPETKTDRKTLMPLSEILGYYAALLNNKIFLFHTLSASVLFAGVIAWIVTGPFIIMETYHGGMWEYGIYQFLVCAAFILGSRLNKPLLTYITIPQLIQLGLTTLTLGSFMSLLGGWIFSAYLISGLIGLFLYQMGVALVFSAFHRLAVDACDIPMGMRIAAYSTGITLSGAVGSLLASSFALNTWVSLAALLFVLSLITIGLQTMRYYAEKSSSFQVQQAN